MSEEWLIDGYNLLHSLALDRQRLVETLLSFSSLKNLKVLLVFDGVGNDEEWSSFQTSNLKIIHSQLVSADSTIEKYLFEHKGKSLFKVVTNDYAITQMARGFGAAVYHAEEFLKLLKETDKDKEDKFFQEKITSHGFNRPFHDKLKAWTKKLS